MAQAQYISLIVNSLKESTWNAIKLITFLKQNVPKMAHFQIFWAPTLMTEWQGFTTFEQILRKEKKTLNANIINPM